MLQEIAVYIHWPFCKFKCPYCDFNSYVRGSVDQEEWLSHYLDELRYYRSLLGDRKVVSIFFGGGTPSLMEVSTVEAILREINNLWEVADGAEITLEANPTSVEAEKFKGFRSAGVNRLSLGVQSLRADDLKALGRQHSVDDAINALKLARDVFERYSFDLIYTRQNQSLKDWEDELIEALQYAGGHMSLYQLTVEEGTPFNKLLQKGEIILPDEENSIAMYELTQEIMEKHNLPCYEVSNYATAGQESRHNLVYWNYGDYIGIGAGAHGRITIDGQKLAISDHKVPEDWKNGRGMVEVLIDEEKLREELMMGLRLVKGIKWRDEFLKVINKAKLDILIAENLVVVDNGIIKTTKQGMQKLNAVLAYMF